VCKEAADVVVCDDSFAHITEMIFEGRLVFANIRKTMSYVLAHAIPELVPVFCLLVFDLPIMLTATLILTVDLLTEQIPSMSLAYEYPEALLMVLPPRDRETDRLVDRKLIVYAFFTISVPLTLACVGAFFLSMTQDGYTISSLLYQREYWLNPPPEAAAALARGVGAYFFTLAVSQAVFHVFIVKTTRASVFTHNICRNWLTAVGSIIAICVAVIVIFVLGGSFFGTGGMPQATSWIMCFSFLAVALPVTEAIKACARSAPNGCCSRRVAL
jgi:sodium/potassium-transporting ATPase subunit alpha